MKITAYAAIADKTGKLSFQNFIVETFFSLTTQYIEHNFIIITDKKLGYSFLSNTKITVKPQPENFLLKKIWWDVKLPMTLKKIEPDLFISFDDACSFTASIPQLIVIYDAERIKPRYIKKAKLLVVKSESEKRYLIDKYKLPNEKIFVVYSSAGKIYKAIDTVEKERIKKEQSDDKEYFLYNSTLSKNEDFIDLLKSFSHFKKRQQSSFKLLLLTASNPFFKKSLKGYKYRNDVRFISINDKNNQAMITAAAYAVILPFNTKDDLISALNAMRSGVPVIATKNSIVNEVATDAALYAETGIIKDIGEKMMQLYTDENYRSSLIEKGITVTKEFTTEKAVESLWQAINKALE